MSDTDCLLPTSLRQGLVEDTLNGLTGAAVSTTHTTLVLL